jgi:hypothetical protein
MLRHKCVSMVVRRVHETYVDKLTLAQLINSYQCDAKRGDAGTLYGYSLFSRFLLAAAWHHLSINYPALIVGHRAAQFWLDYLFIYFFQDPRIFFYHDNAFRLSIGLYDSGDDGGSTTCSPRISRDNDTIQNKHSWQCYAPLASRATCSKPLWGQFLGGTFLNPGC